MASVSWTATTNGTWSNTANWSLATGPLVGDDVSVFGSAGPITVTYNTAFLTVDSLNTNNASLAVTSGTLAVVNGYSLTGSLAESGGLLRLVAGDYGSQINGAVSLTGGTLSVVGGGLLTGSALTQSSANAIIITRGALTDQETFSTLAGTVSGPGELILNGGAATLAAGFVLSTGSAFIENGTVYLSENLSYGNAFTLAQAATLNLGTSTLTLTGLGSLNGVIASSVLNVSGTGHFNGLTLENGSQLSLTGTYSQTGAINLGQTGTGTLSIGSQGALRITNNSGITNTNSGGVIKNAGMLTKTGGNALSGSTNIAAAIINTGTINVAVGTMAFYGPSNGNTSTLGGTITGAGTVAFETGNFAISSNTLKLSTARMVLTNSASVTLTSSGTLTSQDTLTYGGAYNQTGGTLVVGSLGQAVPTELALTGLVSMDGGLLKGTGTVLCSGAVHLSNNMALEGNLTFDFGGTAASALAAAVTQTSTIQFGAEVDAITVAIVGAHESWLLEGGSSIIGSNGTIDNAGLFEKLGGGNSIVQNEVNNTGSLVVNGGTLTLSGLGGGILGGSVSGSAALDISGNVGFASNLSLTVGELILDNGQIGLAGDLAYAKDWSQEGGVLGLNGHTLTLNGLASLESGAIQGAGTVIVNGPAVIGQGPIVTQPLSLVQGAQLILNGKSEQSGTIALTGGSAAPTLTIGSTSIYTLDAGAAIGLPSSSVFGTVVVSGTLVASGAGTSTLTAAVVDNGAIRVTNGDLSFIGPLSGTGSIAISSGGTLELNGTSIEQNAIGFGAGGGVLSIAHPEVFGSTISGFTSGDVIELQGFAFANLLPVISGDSVTLTEASGQSITLNFNTAQIASSLMLGEGPHGGLALIHI